MKDADNLFQRINDLAGQYFSLVGAENVENERKSLEAKTIIALYDCYKLDGRSKDKYGNEHIKVDSDSYADDIVTISRNCLKNYPDSDACRSGIAFSQYLYSSIKRRIAFLKEKADLSARNGGSHITDDEQKKIKKIRKMDGFYAAERDETLRNKKIAFALEMPVDEVVRLKDAAARTTAGLEVEDKDEEGVSLLELISSPMVGPEEELIQEEAVKGLLDCIESVWKGGQDRVKPYLAALVTRWTLEIFSKQKDLSAEDIRRMLRGRAFCDSELLDACCNATGGTLPSQQEVAKRFGKDKSDASRTMGKFIKALREETAKAAPR